MYFTVDITQRNHYSRSSRIRCSYMLLSLAVIFRLAFRVSYFVLYYCAPSGISVVQIFTADRHRSIQSPVSLTPQLFLPILQESARGRVARAARRARKTHGELISTLKYSSAIFCKLSVCSFQRWNTNPQYLLSISFHRSSRNLLEAVLCGLLAKYCRCLFQR